MRVPMDFSWPLGKVWGGYVNPYYAQCTDCPDCAHGYDRSGGRPDANAALFHDQWYGNAPFDPAAYGADPISQFDPAIWRLARRNVERAPDYYMTPDEQYERMKFKATAMAGFPGDERPLIPFPAAPDREAAVTREARRLYEVCFRWHWHHHLIQADVDALLEADRLWDFTRVPRDGGQALVVAIRMAFHGTNSWLPESNGYRPTVAEVNEWFRGGSSLSGGCDAGVCIRARCKREGVPYMCARCKGSGRVWPSEEIEHRYEEWKGEGPPAGDGYQLWSTTSEGSPVSPVFASLDALCAWAEDNATTFADFTATKEEWREMLDGGVVHHREGNNIYM
jgi:hypothetical protein